MKQARFSRVDTAMLIAEAVQQGASYACIAWPMAVYDKLLRRGYEVRYICAKTGETLVLTETQLDEVKI